VPWTSSCITGLSSASISLASISKVSNLDGDLAYQVLAAADVDRDHVAYQAVLLGYRPRHFGELSRMMRYLDAVGVI